MTNCVFCDSHKTTYFLEDVILCSDCKSIFREKSNITKNIFTKFEGRKSFKDKKFWEMNASGHLTYLESKGVLKQTKSALDVGAYFGHLVKKLEGKKIDVLGLESNPSNVKHATTKNIKQVYFDEHYSIKKKYDLVCLTQMLYYLPDTKKGLLKAKEIVNDDGCIFIATINPESPYYHDKTFEPFKSKSVNQLPSIQAYRIFAKELELEMIDNTIIRSNLFIDMNSKNKIGLLKQMIGIKKKIEKDPDGFHMFMLLKKK